MNCFFAAGSISHLFFQGAASVFHNGQLSQQQSLAALLVVKVYEGSRTLLHMSNWQMNLSPWRPSSRPVVSCSRCGMMSMSCACHIRLLNNRNHQAGRERFCFNNGLAPLTGVASVLDCCPSDSIAVGLFLSTTVTF